jgi:hypothetical protein
VSAFVTAGAGFLLAVLWFDLMFDVQALRAPAGELGEERLASTAARPMNRLIALVMLATLAAIVVEIVEGGVPTAVAWVSLALAAAAIGLAGARTVPQAVRLGTRADSTAGQGELARAVGREHVFCFAAIAALIALQLSCS